MLEHRLREAERLDAIGRLAAGIAHDFNNVLLAIRGNAELAAKASEPASRAARASEQVISAADRAAALTRQLLAFGRRQVLSPEVFDLNELVRHATATLQRVAGPEYLVDFERGERALVRVDGAELEQAVANLVANARDSMPGGGRILVRTGCGEIDASVAAAHGAPAGRYGMIRVSDHGAGMDPELLAHVFEPFFTTKRDGTGLGLAAVHGVVAQSGGIVVSESEPGRGSTFGIYLPLVDVAATAPPRLAVVPGRRAARENVLLAASDAGARDVMVAMLQEAGYEVLAARDMADALELAHGHEIAVLVTDLSLPGGEGPALARAVTADQAAVRVLVVSGRIDDAADAGGYPLLEKPFSAEALVDAVRYAASGSIGAPPV